MMLRVCCALSILGLIVCADAWAQSAPPPSRLALANPASVNCAKQGGTTEIRNGEGGQVGYCRFPDGRICEEWALLRDQRCEPPR